MHKLTRKNYTQSRGIALMVSTIVLTVVLLLTLSSIENTRTNKEIATNFSNKLQRQAAAEAAISEAETYINTTTLNLNNFVEDCTQGLCQYQQSKEVWNDKTVWDNAKNINSTFKDKTNIQENPKYIIEYIGDKRSQDSLGIGSGYGSNLDTSNKPIYKVTGKAKGKNGKKETVIQSTIY